MNNNLKIERIDRPNPEFLQQYIPTSRKPVIITGTMTNWKALSLWTDDYLNSILGDTELKIAVSQSGLFRGDPKYGYTKLLKQMKFSEFIDLLRLNRNSKDIFYNLSQASIPKLLPKIFPDIECPVYCENKLLDSNSINLWLGSGGNTTYLHYDYVDNFLAQVRDRKRFVLFDPWQTAFLYPFPANCEVPNYSYINLDRPDLAKFPKFSQAKFSEVILEAGEILFIPAFWWHQVYSLDSDQFPTISVNFWCKAPLKKWLTPPGRRYPALIPKMIGNKVLRWHRKIKTKLKFNK